MRILVVEDDKRTYDYVRKGFAEAGHVADVLVDGHDALAHASREPYDVLVVDRMIPGLDGLSLVKALRASGNTTPVLFLTAVGGVDDRVDGLEAGGDDYLVKPFAFPNSWPASTRWRGVLPPRRNGPSSRCWTSNSTSCGGPAAGPAKPSSFCHASFLCSST